MPYPPTYNSKYGYLNWESMSNLSYYTRILPPVPEDCPTPMGVKGEPPVSFMPIILGRSPEATASVLISG